MRVGLDALRVYVCLRALCIKRRQYDEFSFVSFDVPKQQRTDLDAHREDRMKDWEKLKLEECNGMLELKKNVYTTSKLRLITLRDRNFASSLKTRQTTYSSPSLVIKYAYFPAYHLPIRYSSSTFSHTHCCLDRQTKHKLNTRQLYYAPKSQSAHLMMWLGRIKCPRLSTWATPALLHQHDFIQLAADKQSGVTRNISICKCRKRTTMRKYPRVRTRMSRCSQKLKYVNE